MGCSTSDVETVEGGQDFFSKVCKDSALPISKVLNVCWLVHSGESVAWPEVMKVVKELGVREQRNGRGQHRPRLQTIRQMEIQLRAGSLGHSIDPALAVVLCVKYRGLGLAEENAANDQAIFESHGPDLITLYSRDRTMQQDFPAPFLRQTGAVVMSPGGASSACRSYTPAFGDAGVRRSTASQRGQCKGDVGATLTCIDR